MVIYTEEVIHIQFSTNTLENVRAKYAHLSGSESVYHTLKESIIQLQLKPGEQISENDISSRLKISRTPVREAFIRLSLEHLLEVYPQRGTFVSKIDLGHVEEARFIREHLETAVVKLAAESFPPERMFELETNMILFERAYIDKQYVKMFELDEQFHETIARGSGKERIWTIIKQMKAHLDRVRVLTLASNYHGEEILSQHRAILYTIQSNQPDEAQQVMTQHLHLVLADLEALKRDYPEYLKE
jgi:DNA-binding GntR family transcriptional regulator